ncbi:MAG: family 78 glycoside hydrolase catalytic domain [Bacteroidota bacterium]
MKYHFSAFLSLTLIITGIMFTSSTIAKNPGVTSLVTEYKTNPLGIDIEKPRLSWKIKSAEKNVVQTAYHIQAALSLSDLKKGKNLVWTTGKVESDQSIHIEYEGEKLKSRQRIYWRIKVWTNKGASSWSSGQDFFEMALMNTEDWEAEWISDGVLGDLYEAKEIPMFRKEFALNKTIKSARVYATSLGIYELKINGKRVSDALFAPGWTSYNKRHQYQTYDITDHLKKGANAIGATVADGWYRGHLAGWAHPNRNQYGEKLALLAQIEVNYTDGTKEIITSDQSWKYNYGPIRWSDIYMGEQYDARMEIPGWDMINYDEKGWMSVETLDVPKSQLFAQVAPFVRRMLEVKPVSISVTPEGDTLVNMGQNMVGWVKWKLKGKKDQAVILRHIEVLDKHGNIFTTNLKGAKQEINYTFKEDGEVEFEPNFTFQGFQYFTISGLDYMPKPEEFTGVVIYSDMELTGEFTCSNPLINKLQQNIQWGQRGNFLDVPTDCPQRQERLGWTGDAQVFAPTAAFNMDVASFFTKWLGDVAADQREDGAVGHIIPYIDVLGEGGHGSAAWADAVTVVPYTVYQYYGDKRILATNYLAMKAWVEYMRGKAGDNLLYNTGFHYGDWLAYTTDNSDYPGATTAKDIIQMAYFARSTELLSKTAGILGKSEEEKEYSELLEKIKVVFNDEYITKNGRVSSNTQTAYVLALGFDLVPKEKELLTAQKYVENIRKFGHITTGFVGTPLVCHVLTKYGYNDDAFNLLTRKEYPSWLYPVTKGATTIWERWDGIMPNGDINMKSAFTTDDDEDIMNSFNHYAYGAIGDWMYKVVAGIDFTDDGVGFKKMIIKPTIGGSLTNASASQETMYGTVRSSWRLEGERVILDVEIPSNTSATVFVPNAKGEYEKHKIGSGIYKFER